MPKHDTKECPRCQDAFECKVGTITECQCSTVAISHQTQQYLANTQYDCLCANCLTHLNSLVEQAAGLTFPTKKHEFVEGLHYYIENGFWVFTELYHMLRGHCCGNGCRHCTYGFSPKK